MAAVGREGITQMCHRFVNFETHDHSHSPDQVCVELERYIMSLKEMETKKAIMYYKTQNKDPVCSGMGFTSSQMPGEFLPVRTWTLCVVFDP